jgi:hypothetical protein
MSLRVLNLIPSADVSRAPQYRLIAVIRDHVWPGPDRSHVVYGGAPTERRTVRRDGAGASRSFRLVTVVTPQTMVLMQTDEWLVHPGTGRARPVRIANAEIWSRPGAASVRDQFATLTNPRDTASQSIGYRRCLIRIRGVEFPCA